jgi:hypothetical protein
MIQEFGGFAVESSELRVVSYSQLAARDSRLQTPNSCIMRDISILVGASGYTITIASPYE